MLNAFPLLVVALFIKFCILGAVGWTRLRSLKPSESGSSAASNSASSHLCTCNNVNNPFAVIVAVPARQGAPSHPEMGVGTCSWRTIGQTCWVGLFKRGTLCVSQNPFVTLSVRPPFSTRFAENAPAVCREYGFLARC